MDILEIEWIHVRMSIQRIHTLFDIEPKTHKDLRW